ncbi:hypothetical protein XaFJ1_GM001923 [Xanthomonas albilineans]|nr:hypothetical protein XaFJ1_GM001923 [Xanthomonas albilineans]
MVFAKPLGPAGDCGLVPDSGVSGVSVIVVD